MRVPASRCRLQRRVSASDVAWAIAAPALSLIIRDLDIDDWATSSPQIIYCLVSAAAALCCFWWFRISDAIPRYFTAIDAMEIVKAGCCAAVSGTVITFALTRLEGIPRSTPFIFALVLIAGLLVARAIVHFYFLDGSAMGDATRGDSEHIIIIGADHGTSPFVKLLRTGISSPRVVAILDERPAFVGRAIAGVRIMGSSSDLEAIVDEFAVHGVGVGRVVVSGAHLDPPARQHIVDVCARRQIACDTVAHMAARCLVPISGQGDGEIGMPAEAAYGTVYLAWKRWLDVAVGVAALVAVAPIMALVSLVVMIDLGAPVLFWQRRVGRNGKPFLLYKFRTLRAPFDRHGCPLSDSERLSSVGALLRALHIDELPQLLNVIKGDMSLVGPRPLLPVDQPTTLTSRLMVRPGITGWAQLNGGKSISAIDKAALDDWYVTNLSLMLDAKIMLVTMVRVLKGGSNETWIADAVAVGAEKKLS